jgi:hypothetical protein
MTTIILSLFFIIKYNTLMQCNSSYLANKHSKLVTIGSNTLNGQLEPL